MMASPTPSGSQMRWPPRRTTPLTEPEQQDVSTTATSSQMGQE